MLDKKLERHAILKNSKLDLIDLPMTQGSMDDISEELTITQRPSQVELSNDVEMSEDGAATSAGPAHTESLNTLSTNDQSILFEKESRIKIDYRKLDTDFLNVFFIFKIFLILNINKWINKSWTRMK